MESDKQNDPIQTEDKRKNAPNSTGHITELMENKDSTTSEEEGLSAATLVAEEEVPTEIAISQISELTESHENKAEPQQVVANVETAINSAEIKSNSEEIKEAIALDQSASTIFEQSFESAKSLNDSIIFETLPEDIEDESERIDVTHKETVNINSDNVDVESIVMQAIETLVETSVLNAAETFVEAIVSSGEAQPISKSTVKTAQEHQENNTVTECQVSENEINGVNLPSGSYSAPPLKIEEKRLTNPTLEILSVTQITHGIPTNHLIVNQIALDDKEIINDNSEPEKDLLMDTSVDIQDEFPDVTGVNQNLTTSEISEAPSGLSLLAQYISDNDGDNDEDNEIEKVSDSDSVIEVLAGNNLDYRKKVIELDSDTTSDSSESDVEYLAEIRKTIEKSIEVEVADDDDDADDDENSGKSRRQVPRVKGEFLIDDLPPIQDLHITVPEEDCIELGKVHSIVDQLVLVNALPNSVLLDLETVLFFDKGQRVLGEVFDVLGQVADPLYCVRFNSNKQIKEKNIQIGEVVYVAPKTQYTQFVILSSLMKMRGSDASWENDIEPPPRYLDYSDDEQEREARARRRNKDRPYDHIDLTKRTRSDIDCKIEETSPSPSPSPLPSQQHHHQRRVPLYLRGRDEPRSQRHQQQPHNFRSNYNANSWHSNYPQHFRGPFPPPNFAPSPHVSFNTMYPPLNFAAYPPPQGMPPPQQQQQQQQGQQPPMYVLNPYAVRGSVLPPRGAEQMPMYFTQPPPPPPPGAQ